MSKIRYCLLLILTLFLTVPAISSISYLTYILVAPTIHLGVTDEGKIFSLLIPVIVSSPVNAAIFTLYYLLRVKKSELSETVVKLELALAEVRELQGIIPICSYCHKIRDESEVWNRMEQYISTRTKALFSHGICPDCDKRLIETERMKAKS